MKKRRNLFETFTEITGWIQIMLSPLLLAALVAFFLYNVFPSTLTLVLGILITLVGLITGSIYATKIWKKKGTVNFMSRISATPDLDEKTPENK